MKRFEWDKGNLCEISAHDVTPGEFEEAFASRKVAQRRLLKGERRAVAIGITRAGRILVLVYTKRGRLFRAVTAFESRKARRGWQG
jgi:uncharacterized DUF497 family protein